MTEKEIQPIVIDGKIIDLNTKEVIEDLNIGTNKFKDIKTRKSGNLTIKMTENKQLTHRQVLDLIEEVYQDYFIIFQNDKMEFRDFAILENVLIKIQEKLKETKPKNKLKEFRVVYGDTFGGFRVTNDEYSVSLINEDDAVKVCNMLNRIRRSME